MQFCRSTVCCVANVVVVVGLVIDSVAAKDSSADPLNRLRRSVNFTPSWGKRSGVVDAASEFLTYLFKDQQLVNWLATS